MTEEKELDFSYILQTIGKWFLLILLFVILGIGGAIFYNYGAPIIYQSKTTLYVQPQVNASEVDYEGILTNQKMVKTYTQIIKSRKILKKVIDNLALKMTYNDLNNMVGVTSTDDTQIITIVVNSVDNNEAKEIANEISKVFIEDIAETMEITNIKVIDEAIVGKDPISPRVLLNCAIGLMGGLFIGLGLSFMIESMDNKIKNHEDVKRHLKIKTLGVVPHNSIDYEVSGKKKVYINPNEVNLKILSDPTSVVSESIRMIRTNLNFLDIKLINVTSTVPSEGKSEVISNLAVSFALLDKKVLVVDCDLRKPKVHKNFGLSRNKGVSDIVLSKGELHYKEAVQSFTDKNTKVSIDILSAGSKISNPSELINNKGFSILLGQLKQDYDLVLIDCPPISSLTDGVLVSKLCDGTVYVIESERTDHQVIESCIEELKNNKAFMLGAILTKVNIKRQKKLYGYKYDYYYSNYNK